MTPIQTAAYVFAASVRVLAYVEGMKAENMQREQLGHSMAYTEAAFAAVIEAEGIGCNDILEMFRGAE